MSIHRSRETADPARHSSAIRAIWVLAVLSPVVVAATSQAFGQSADLVLCDRLAADPADPDKPADVPGVASIAPSDIATAIKFCKNAGTGSRRALFELGRAYAASQEMSAAAAAFRKAADKGSSAAMVALGRLYAAGSGVPKDEAQARKLFERAAQAGNGRGAAELAGLSAGTANSGDPAEARALLSKAVTTNSADAQFQLGLMYAQGIGGPQDDVAARGLFEQAAAQNHPDALDWLGSFAASGRGGPKDAEAAKGYYERAAALGNEDAKTALHRLKCPYVFTDKKGQVLTNLCF
jgi:TPR repeat protein